ncbi:MAG: hypothetical protein WAN36_13270 [Calditrichia bacterium]
MMKNRSLWDTVSEKLIEKFPALSESNLSSKAPVNFPVEDETRLGEIAFLLQHESYHTGQLSLLRKWLGFQPMSYDE